MINFEKMPFSFKCNIYINAILNMGFCLLYLFMKVKDSNFKHKNVPFYIISFYNHGNF